MILTNPLMVRLLAHLYASGMGHYPVAPQDRATAQLLIVMSPLVALGGAAALLFMDPQGLTRWGIPAWVLSTAVTVFGVVGVIRGIRMWRKDDGSTPPDEEDPEADGREGTEG